MTRVLYLTLPGACAVAALGVSAPAAAQADTDIHLLTLGTEDGRLIVASPPTAVTDRAGYDNQPQFTADGVLLFTSIRDGQADTYRHDPATGRTTRLTATPESEYSPTPIPGSDRFSVVRVEADSAQRLWSFAGDGSDPRRILAVEPVGYHAWLAAGRVGLFVLGEPPTLRLAETGAGTARVVAGDIGRSLQRVPDGDAISFTQRDDEGWWVRRLESSGRIRTIAPLPGPELYHAWTPDGRLLTARGTEVLELVPGSGTWRRVVDLAEHGLGAVTRLAVSPDGRTLAVVADRAT